MQVNKEESQNNYHPSIGIDTINNAKKDNATPVADNSEKSLKNENQLNTLKERLSNCTTVEQVHTLHDECFLDCDDYLEYMYLFADRIVEIKVEKQKDIEILKKAKTKFDIAYALDRFYPKRRFTLLLDIYSKKELVELKNKCLLENGVTL